MDSLISEMEKLLTSGREDIQDIIGETAGKNIDDLLIEADKLIYETLPYFQTTSNVNENEIFNTFESINVKATQSTNQRNDVKKVVFNLKENSPYIQIPKEQLKTPNIIEKLDTNKHIKKENIKKTNIQSMSSKSCMMPEFKAPEVNILKPQSQMSTTLLENHNRLQILCHRHDKLVNNKGTQNQINKLKLEEELSYYKLKNIELEKNLITKEQEVCVWENRYQQLHQYCESSLKRNVEETLKSYDCQLNELIKNNTNRETQLRSIIINLLREIDKSHILYRIKLFETNEQIRQYLDQIERILDSVYILRNKNTER